MGFVFIFYLAFVIIYETFNPAVSDLESNLKQLKYFDISGITTTLPYAIFAYMCHPNVLDIFHVILSKNNI